MRSRHPFLLLLVAGWVTTCAVQGLSEDIPLRLKWFHGAQFAGYYAAAERGFYAELWAYQTHDFVDFREVQDNEAGHYGRLNAHLRGRGVPSIDEALRELIYGPVLVPLRMLVSAPAFRLPFQQITTGNHIAQWTEEVISID